ncbi:hypothetical protein ACMFMG_000190 [Clarireedia jacksonii]
MPSVIMRHLIEIFIILVHSRVVFTLCYSFDKKVQSNYLPCNTSAPVSMCCNNRANCGTGAQLGLCVHMNQIDRGFCTDQTWQSSSCLKLCLSGNKGNASKITACSNGSFCCGTNAQDCCEANKGSFIVNGQVADSPASSDPTKKGLSTTTSRVIGISVGIVLGAVAVLAALIFFWRKRKTKQIPYEANSKEIRMSSTHANSEPVRAELDAQEQAELDAQETLLRRGVASQLTPVEMP